MKKGQFECYFFRKFTLSAYVFKMIDDIIKEWYIRDTSVLLVYCEPEDGYRSAVLDNVSANVPDADIKKKLADMLPSR